MENVDSAAFLLAISLDCLKIYINNTNKIDLYVWKNVDFYILILYCWWKPIIKKISDNVNGMLEYVWGSHVWNMVIKQSKQDIKDTDIFFCATLFIK